MIKIKRSKTYNGRFILEVGQYIYHISRKELEQIHENTKKLLKRSK